MSPVLSEETHRNLISRVPDRTGRDVSDRLRTVADGPALRFEEKVSRPRNGHDLAYGHAKALIHEYDLRRAARKPLRPGPPYDGTARRHEACGPFRRTGRDRSSPISRRR